MEEARCAWRGERSAWPDSDIFTTETEPGVEVHLQARALRVGDHNILTVQPLESVFRRFQESLDRERGRLIEYRRKEQDLDYKETMVHCLIHDVVGGLSVADVIFRRMQQRDDLTPEETESLDIGRNAMHSVSHQLRSVMDVYSAEIKAIEFFETDPDLAPDILDCVMLEVYNCGPALRNKDVKVVTDLPEDQSVRWPVIGEQSKLQRIIFNLIENALRYSPRGGRLTVSVAESGEQVKVSVIDEGPGVPEADAPQIFKKFAKDRKGGGKGGLGLYFARLMIERWGGTIGYEPAKGGGAIFWFELPRAVEPKGD